MRIVGFDPGTIATGYGVVSFDAGCLIFESCGVFRPPAALSFAGKLHVLFARAAQLLEECRPAAVSVETVFAGRNVASAMKLAHARGVLLAAAAQLEIPVYEYEKPQVRSMVLTLLARQRSRMPLDAADALAVAICHAHAGTDGRR